MIIFSEAMRVDRTSRNAAPDCLALPDSKQGSTQPFAIIARDGAA